MKWSIPAKTFLLGEYVAMAGGPAIIVTTSPTFSLSLSLKNTLVGFAENCPTASWWQAQALNRGLHWLDPYQKIGGMGASSAQFLSAYLARCHLLGAPLQLKPLLQAYFTNFTPKEGMQPSGYDLLAQSQNYCVYINYQQNEMTCFDWPFKELSFLLVHTGKKLATHHHLQALKKLPNTSQLAMLVRQARNAFEQVDSAALIAAVQDYQTILAELQLTVPHSLSLLAQLQQDPAILAAKGCGAGGADVVLLLLPTEALATVKQRLLEQGLAVLGSRENLYTASPLIESMPV